MALLRRFQPVLEEIEDEAVASPIAGPEIALAETHEIEGDRREAVGAIGAPLRIGKPPVQPLDPALMAAYIGRGAHMTLHRKVAHPDRHARDEGRLSPSGLSHGGPPAARAGPRSPPTSARPSRSGAVPSSAASARSSRGAHR